jgi:hypothetical protein
MVCALCLPRPGLLYVIDIRTNTVVKTIRGLPGITGLEYVPGLNNTLGKAVGVVDVD